MFVIYSFSILVWICNTVRWLQVFIVFQAGRVSYESRAEDLNDLQIQILPKAEKTSRSNLNAVSMTPPPSTANKPNNNIAMTTSHIATTSSQETDVLQRTPLTSSMDLSHDQMESTDQHSAVRISAL